MGDVKDFNLRPQRASLNKQYWPLWANSQIQYKATSCLHVLRDMSFEYLKPHFWSHSRKGNLGLLTAVWNSWSFWCTLFPGHRWLHRDSVVRPPWSSAVQKKANDNVSGILQRMVPKQLCQHRKHFRRTRVHLPYTVPPPPQHRNNYQDVRYYFQRTGLSTRGRQVMSPEIWTFWQEKVKMVCSWKKEAAWDCFSTFLWSVRYDFQGKAVLMAAPILWNVIPHLATSLLLLLPSELGFIQKGLCGFMELFFC